MRGYFDGAEEEDDGKDAGLGRHDGEHENQFPVQVLGARFRPDVSVLSGEEPSAK